MESFHLLLCLLIASLVGLGQCLDCHECAQISSPTCHDPYDSDANEDNIATCDDGSHCVKYKTVIRIRDSGYIMGWERDSIVVTRACEPTKGVSTGCTRWQGAGGFTIKCRCDSDGCNTARALQPAVLLTTLTSLLAVWLLRR